LPQRAERIATNTVNNEPAERGDITIQNYVDRLEQYVSSAEYMQTVSFTDNIYNTAKII